jgi:tetratricopeptide (TPR) repeat protein
MDGLPLALDQAGSYIAGNSCTLSHYLDLFRKEQSRLLEERGVSFTDHPQSVAATWALALEEVKHANPIAIELLHLCVFLDPDSIHRDIFIEGASVLGPLLRPTAKDPISLDQTLGELRKYSIISDSLDAGVLTIHRLLLSVIKSTMNPEDQHLWAERAVRAVNCVFPRIDPPNVEEVDASSWAEARSVCRRYFPHAQVCAQLIQERRLVFIEAAQLLGKLARYLEEISAFGDAKRHYRDMLSMNEEIGTVEPSQLIVAHNDVATFYEKRGENKEALTSYEEGIKVVGIGHPSAEMTELLSNYATLLERMGRRSEASKVKEHLTERLQQKKIRAITINDDNGEIKYYGEWIPRKSGEEENPQLRTYGGSTHYTEKENSSFTYTFSGIGIAILSDTVSAQGKIEIFIDDRYMQGRDTTLPESEQLPQSVVFHHVKLKRGNHTIRVELVEGSFALGALTIFDVSENAL